MLVIIIEYKVSTNLSSLFKLRSCLKVDPSERSSIDDIITSLEGNFVDLKSPCVQPDQIKSSIPSQTASLPSQIPSSPPPPHPGSAQPAFGLSSFTKYLKDISTNISTKIKQTSGPIQSSLAPQEKPPQQQPRTQAGTEPVQPRQPPSRPPPARPAPPATPPSRSVPPARPPPPKDLQSESPRSSTTDSRLQQDDTSNSHDEHEPTSDVVGDLLNLSLDEPSERAPLKKGTTQRSKSQEEDHLLIDPVCDERNNRQTNNNNNNSAFDLLNDIFYSNGNQQVPPTGVQANLPKPDLLFPSSSAAANHISSNSQPLHRNTSTPNLTQIDPFADLNSFVKPSPPGNTTPTSLHDIQTPPQGIPRVSSCSTFQWAQKPDYNRAHFSEAPPTNPTGIPKVSGCDFEDLLVGFPKHSKHELQNKSLAEMKKQELLREGVSPYSLKVNEWKENKKRNIRALLSSLHTVVWDDCNWQPVGLQLLMSYNDVKKMYRKACLAVHPDKVSI